MADNSTRLDAASATETIWTDEIAGSIKVPGTKIILGADGAASVVLDDGQQTMANSLPVVLASNQSNVNVLVTGGGSLATVVSVSSMGTLNTLTNVVSVGSMGTLNTLTSITNPVALAESTAGVGKVDPQVSTPTLYNVTLTNADTEYSQAMPANCRGFEFQARSSNAIRAAFVTGKVAGPTAPYISVKADGSYASRDIAQGASPSTLYLGCNTSGVIVEIVAWT